MSDIKMLHLYSCELDAPTREVTLPTPLMHQDAYADVFRIHVTRGGLDLQLDGMTVRAWLYLAATGETMLLEGSVDGSMALVTLQPECYLFPGYATLAIQLQQGEDCRTLIKINLAIHRTSSDVVIDPSNVLPTLPQLLAQIAAMEQGTAAANAAAEAANTAAANAKEFIITVTQPAVILDGDTSGITADKTFAEINAAINAGKTPVVRLKTQGKLDADTLHLYKSASLSIVFRQQVKHTEDYNIVSAMQCTFIYTGAINVDSVNFRSVPDNGTDGQVLVKTGDSTYGWQDSGELAAVTALTQEIKDNCAKLEPGKNKFDKNNVRTGYVDFSNGNVGAVPSFCHYLIACQPGETYVTSQTYADGIPYSLHVAFFDDVFDAAHYLGGVLTQDTFTTPENCTIVSVSVMTVDADSLQVEKSPVKTLYQPYEKKVQYSELGTDVMERIKKKVVHVGVDGNTEYEYDSILEALIANPTDTIIYLHSGVYDVAWMYQRYYGSDYFEKYAGYAGTGNPMDAGLFLGDGVEIIGIGNVRVEFVYTGDNEAVKQRFSVFSTTQNNVIDNITIYTSNNQCCRYHIHDDYSETLEGGGTNHFRGIVFDGYTALGTCIGGGMGKKNTYIIEDCLFTNLGQAIAISYHNCIDDAVNKLIVKNNYCDGSIRILHYGVSGANTSKALITNNYCTMVRVLFTDETNYPNANIQVFEWGNEKTQQ